MCPESEGNIKQDATLFDLLFSNIQPDQMGWTKGDITPTPAGGKKYSENCMVVLHDNDLEIKSGCYVYEQNQWLLYLYETREDGALLSTERVEPSQVKYWKFLSED